MNLTTVFSLLFHKWQKTAVLPNIGKTAAIYSHNGKKCYFPAKRAMACAMMRMVFM